MRLRLAKKIVQHPERYSPAKQAPAQMRMLRYIRRSPRRWYGTCAICGARNDRWNDVCTRGHTIMEQWKHVGDEDHLFEDELGVVYAEDWTGDMVQVKK
jgi:hypothetical protein